jgi:post-segregation antitoxin (ccd killing protein)
VSRNPRKDALTVVVAELNKKATEAWQRYNADRSSYREGFADGLEAAALYVDRVRRER